MNLASTLAKEKIVSLSELGRNPSKALDADIVRVVKNGKEIGIYMKREEFIDFVEQHLELKDAFKEKLSRASHTSKKVKKLSTLT